MYEEASGQLINLEKSSVFFSKNMPMEQRQDVCSALGGMTEMTQGKYLGLPMVISRTKEQIFGFIKENIKRKMHDWRNKLLSTAGKEVMLKAVSMAMPTYAMSVFKLPRKLCKDISALMANYWWGEANGKNKLHWLSWRKMSLSRNAGGLGFKDIEAYNKALLGKQVWRILTKPNLLISKVLRARYFPKDSILTCRPKQNASWIWQGLLGARRVVEKGVIRRIGNGRSTSIWGHRWIPGSSSGRPTSLGPQSYNLKMVNELISHHRWKRNTIFQHFNQSDAEKILNIPLSLMGREDNYYWQHNPGGIYTVSSGYKCIMKERTNVKQIAPEEAGPSITGEDQQSRQMWTTLWKLNIKHKVKIFIWKCITGALPVRAAIFRKTRMGDPVCRLCGEDQETVEHLMLNCQHSQQVWKAAPIQWDGAMDQKGDFRRWWIRISEARTRQGGMEHIGLTAIILWQLWKERNSKEFENKTSCSPARTIGKAQKEWLEQEEFTKGKTRLSIRETTCNKEEQHQGCNEEGTIKLEMAITSQNGQTSLGIGVTATKHPSLRLAEWALKERSKGDKVIDEAMAVHLVLCKAFEHQWSRITIQFQSQDLMRQIKYNSPSNSRLATLIEDILSMQKLFRLCLFSLANENSIKRSRDLSSHAFGILVDEEWNFLSA
ncbi:unnamed protein product [Coffea canephora]|uniref:Reverse transcriptase zinc-binding domain-containing protein n=1 Tax=Coffea canephora TaxID=49390 RepID=A0A068V0Z3_COFCA|nr:unnamed protein product [Coffea canephora]